MALDAPLDIIVVRKLGVPFQPELAMGAIGEGGVRLLDSDTLSSIRLSDSDLAEVEPMMVRSRRTDQFSR